MTTLYLDTEFNGFRGDLISLALVSPDGLMFYMAREFEGYLDDWVAQHVLPVLDRPRTPPEGFRFEFHRFLRDLRPNPTIICDWHADAAHFCNMLAGEEYGSSLDFACQIEILKTPPGQPVSKRPHNALADAVALMEWHQSLAQVAA